MGFSSGSGSGDRSDGDVTMTRASFYEFSTDSGIYRCDIGEVLKNTVQPDLVGFSDITVYPNELSWEYAPKKPVGIYIVYRVEDQPQETIEGSYTMERLIELAQAGNTDGLCECFSLATKGDAEDIPEKAQELVEFLHEQMVSWEFYTWTENIEMLDGAKATTREMFFYLHTDNGLYRCDIREVLESRDPADVGVSSISVFPALYPVEEPEYEDEAYKSYGVLKYARRMSAKDAMVFLSRIMSGIADGILKMEEPCPVYAMMLGIQPSNLQKVSERPLGKEDLDEARAAYIREKLPNL